MHRVLVESREQRVRLRIDHRAAAAGELFDRIPRLPERHGDELDLVAVRPTQQPRAFVSIDAMNAGKDLVAQHRVVCIGIRGRRPSVPEPRDHLASFTTTPPFITNGTRCITSMFDSGSPSTAMTSANFPGAIVPRFSLCPRSSAALIV